MGYTDSMAQHCAGETVKSAGKSPAVKGVSRSGFFDDLTKMAKDVATVAADKTKDAAEQVKLSVAIAGEQKEIDKNYRTIGEWFVNEYEGEIPDAVRELVDAVTASKAKIAELEACKSAKDDAAEPVSGEKACPICGAVSDSKFCPHCGAPMGD